VLDLAGPEWKHALELGLRADVVDLDDQGRIAIFARGPVRIAYADFTSGVWELNASYLERVSTACTRMRVDVIRYQAPVPAPGSSSYARYALTSSVIEDLSTWDERDLEKPRRAANRAKRSLVEVRRGRRDDASKIYALYRETIRRHGGSERYTAEYFGEIAESAVRVACFEGEAIGFVAMGRSGDRGIYLHGAHREDRRVHYPSDLLFLAMLRESKAAGLKSFDFLPSPMKQRSLLNYKQLWGAQAREVFVSDQVLTVTGLAFSGLYSAWNRFSSWR